MVELVADWSTELMIPSSILNQDKYFALAPFSAMDAKARMPSLATGGSRHGTSKSPKAAPQLCTAQINKASKGKEKY